VLISNRSSAGIDIFQHLPIGLITSQQAHFGFWELSSALFSASALLKSEHWNKEVAKVSTADWLDAEGWKKPSSKVQRTALELVGSCSWLSNFGDPNLTTSPEGRIVFEWWNGSKKLTLYVDERGFEYIKVLGPDMETEMEDGYSTNLLEAITHLVWLHG
jgi:hypothetical protein